jgi:hypothetical protein
VAEAGRDAEEQVTGKHKPRTPIAHTSSLGTRRRRKPRSVSLQPFVTEKLGDLGLAMGRNIEHVPHAFAHARGSEKHPGNERPPFVTESLRVIYSSGRPRPQP